MSQGPLENWSRRRWLGACVAVGAGLSWPKQAEASLARALTLEELTQATAQTLTATPVFAHSRWEQIGGRKRIVTYTRLQVHQYLYGQTEEQELEVRSLGGRVGEIGQIVHGEAVLELNQPGLFFLNPLGKDVFFVQGMGQGEYPLRIKAGERRLHLSLRLAELSTNPKSATIRLKHRTLAEATQLILEARK